MTAGVTRGDMDSFAMGYTSTKGGANKMSRSVDGAQYAAAIYMIKVATDNMHKQFAAHLTVFEDLA
jgi:hypothetical protein